MIMAAYRTQTKKLKQASQKYLVLKMLQKLMSVVVAQNAPACRMSGGKDTKTKHDAKNHDLIWPIGMQIHKIRCAFGHVALLQKESVAALSVEPQRNSSVKVGWLCGYALFSVGCEPPTLSLFVAVTFWG